MKLKYQIKFALDNMLLQGKQLVISLLTACVVLLLIASIFLMNEMHSKLRSELEITLKQGCKNTGYITRNDDGDEDITQKISDLDCIDAVGYWQLMSSDEKHLKALCSIQKGNVQQDANCSDTYLEEIVMAASAWNLFNLSLSAGETPDKVINNQEYTLLYLGSEYKDYYDVGTILTDKTNKNAEKYIVAGILEQGNTIATEYLNMIDKFTISSAYPLDYAVISVYPDFSSTSTCFSVKEGYRFSEAEAAILQWAKEKNISLTVSNVDASLTTVEQSLKPINRYMEQIIVVVVLSICIVLTCFQSMNILMRQSEYGILYANGVTTRDVVFMILFENSLKLFVSFIFMFPLALYLSKTSFQASYGDSYVIRTILLTSVCPKLLLLVIGIIVVSSIIPIHFIIKQETVTLIGGNRT